MRNAKQNDRLYIVCIMILGLIITFMTVHMVIHYTTGHKSSTASTYIIMEIDGQKETLYIDLNTDEVYEDENLTLEFPNHGDKPWLFTHDVSNPFVMQINE